MRRLLAVILIIVTIFVVVLGGMFVVSQYVINGPYEVAGTYYEAESRGDVQGMLDCYEPIANEITEGVLGVASSFLGEAIGMDLDLSDLMSLAPAFAQMSGSTQQIEWEMTRLEYGSPKTRNGFFKWFGWLGPLMATEAEGEFQVSRDGNVTTETLHFTKRGFNQWYIRME